MMTGRCERKNEKSKGCCIKNSLANIRRNHIVSSELSARIHKFNNILLCNTARRLSLMSDRHYVNGDWPTKFTLSVYTRMYLIIVSDLRAGRSFQSVCNFVVLIRVIDLTAIETGRSARFAADSRSHPSTLLPRKRSETKIRFNHNESMLCRSKQHPQRRGDVDSAGMNSVEGAARPFLD